MSDLDRLVRWETSGGTWRVRGTRPGAQLEISLCRCDGGEEMERLTTAEPAVLAYVGERESSEDPKSGAAEFELAD